MPEWCATVLGAVIAGIIGWFSSIAIEQSKEKKEIRQCEKLIRSQYSNWKGCSLDPLIQRLKRLQTGECREFIMPDLSFPILMDKAEKLKEEDLQIILKLEHEHTQVLIFLKQQHSAKDKIKCLTEYTRKFAQISFLS